MTASRQSGRVIELRSDNSAGVAPEILAALQAANTGSALAYGGDELTAQLQDVVPDDCMIDWHAASRWPRV